MFLDSGMTSSLISQGPGRCNNTIQQSVIYANFRQLRPFRHSHPLRHLCPFRPFHHLRPLSYKKLFVLMNFQNFRIQGGKKSLHLLTFSLPDYFKFLAYVYRKGYRSDLHITASNCWTQFNDRDMKEKYTKENNIIWHCFWKIFTIDGTG